MTEFQYKKAPITEAVVEFRSATPVEEKKRQKALKKLSKLYSAYNPVKQHSLQLKIEHEREPETQTTQIIRDKFSSDDMTQQLHITDILFLVSQLAPYIGWEQFKLRIMRDWKLWRRNVGFRPIERVGMRYINRIDLPITGPLLRYEDYVTVYPTLPTLLDPCINHLVNVKVNMEDIKSVLNLNSAMVESPLPNHMAILVDLDIVRRFDKPPSDEEIYTFIDQARIKKNEVFEACITDKTRELFR